MCSLLLLAPIERPAAVSAATCYANHRLLARAGTSARPRDLST